jgi:surface antigen
MKLKKHKKIIVPLAVVSLLVVVTASMAFLKLRHKTESYNQETSATSQPEATQAQVPASQQVAQVEQTAQSPPVAEPKKEEAKVQATNPFQTGFSAWYVFNKRQEFGLSTPEWANPDGNYWCRYILSSHPELASGSPSDYAIACPTSSTHVAIVEKLNNDGSFWVSEMNSRGQKSISDTTPWGGWHQIDYKLVTTDMLSAYKFIN